MLVSGRGCNAQALLAAMADGRIAARPALVLSSDPKAAALERCGGDAVPTVALDHRRYPGRDAFDAAMDAVLRAHGAQGLLLAGFMRVLTPGFVAAWHGRMLNIHPSLLPDHPGLHTHRRALAAGSRRHGATVHFVTAAVDGGPRVIQGALSVAADDDEDRLAQKVLEQVELKIYPQAASWWARGELWQDGGRAVFRGRVLTAPLTLSDLEPEFR
ncbi:MAG: phosphoribosylglycinamide formyltransferase [Gammaproteobacteria bacterium]|nr:phosphoribosylglycinamide formyltransferase [Gammaproteobacteria bacterium]